MMDKQASPILSVRNLKTYFELDEGIVKAVDGVSFDICPGQVLGVVGESGCGKSVSMRSILRIVEKPGRLIDGRILFRPKHRDWQRVDEDGYIDLASLNPHGKRMRAIRGDEIGLIPQEPMTALSPVHTVGDQVIEAILLHRPVSRKEARQITIERFREVGIPAPEQCLNAYSWELSGGLRQRAIIAMALSCNPAVLIADEPTTAIDVTTQAQVLDLLDRLQQRRNSAIIFVTHDLGVIAQVSDYVVVMYLGRVMERGPVDDIFHAPRHPYTKALLMSIPDVTSKSKVKLPTISGSVPAPFERPSGCPFHPRCPDFVPGRCDQHTPALYPMEGEQPVSCFLYHDLEEDA
jgi:peptide/nickel transport system ATP-binding protein